MSANDRREYLFLIKEAVNSGARKFKACELLDLNLRTIERWEKFPEDRRNGPFKKPSNALSPEERDKVLQIANSSEFANLPPCQIVPKLADRGEYIASESSFYRILREEKLIAHRLKSQPKKNKRPDEIIASRPNMLWSWDITYLKAAIKGTYFYLYLPMDIFSRKIVHWEIYENENSCNASIMIENACIKNEVKKNQIILHSDNGGPMKGATMLATLQRLGIATSFSRPKVSDDNPYSESLFKTLKYCPSFPTRGFLNIEMANTWVRNFVFWYNNIHLHSGINFVTPNSRHEGTEIEILKKRQGVYENAKKRNPNRWSKETRNWARINIVELNPRTQKLKCNKKEIQQAS